MERQMAYNTPAACNAYKKPRAREGPSTGGPRGTARTSEIRHVKRKLKLRATTFTILQLLGGFEHISARTRKVCHMFWRGHNHLAGCKCRCGELQLQVWGPAIAVGGGCICSLGGLQLQPDRLQVQLQMQPAQLHRAFTRAGPCSQAGCTELEAHTI